MDVNTEQLLNLAFEMAAAEEAAVPAGLWDRVQSAVGGPGPGRPRQHAGWNESHDTQLSSLRAYISTAAELAELLESLAPADWTARTPVEGVDVRALVEHLVAVERYVLGQLGRRPRLEAPRREDHWTLATALATDMRHEAEAFVAKTWWSEVLGVVAASGELGPDHAVSYHHLAGSLRGLLVVRTFELWTHGDDVRQATGRPLNSLDEARLSLMVNQLMRVLPLGMALTNSSQPGRTAKLHLTGPGGGSFDVPLAAGEDAGTGSDEPDLTLTTAVIDLCRLAAGRLAPEALDVVVEGDGALLAHILVGATAFAAD
jgi:uncharacterized protein (TIGR03083 family)